MIALIAALTKNRVIGREGRLPWDLPQEMKNFKHRTMGQVCVMGWLTYQSILSSLGKPLPNRMNIVITNRPATAEGVELVNSFSEAMEKAKTYGKNIFLIGGRSVFSSGLEVADTMFLSWVHHDYEGDVLFPEFDLDNWTIVTSEEYPEFICKTYKRKT